MTGNARNEGMKEETLQLILKQESKHLSAQKFFEFRLDWRFTNDVTTLEC